jgi:hypothetical protein
MTTTADKASGNGAATTTSKPVPAQRVHGLNRVREDQCYHLSALIVACLSEAEHLVRKVNSKAFNRTIDHASTKGTEPLNPAELRQILLEACVCAQTATEYLCQAAGTFMGENEHPPF